MIRRSILALVVAVAAAPAYAADGPRLEVSGTFSSMESGSCCLPTTGTIPVGWEGDVAADFTHWFAIVGIVSGNYETIQYQTDIQSFSPKTNTRVYAFLGGPRFTGRIGQNVNVFGQVVFGETHRAWTVNDPFAGEFSGSVNYFAIQPGGGVDLSLNSRWAVRLQADERLTPLEGLIDGRWAIRQFRFATGIVFRP